MAETVLSPSALAKGKVESAIIITGPARSGTTLLGKLLHSFDGVEYQFEPPTLIGLLPLIHQMAESHWRLLYETYLYEDFFVNALAGRTINCNTVDDSSIFKVKSSTEIHDRLNKPFTKAQAEHNQATHQIAFKIPTVAYLLPKLQAYYPHTRIVTIEREPSAVIKSLLGKRSLNDATLAQGTLFWPSYPHQLTSNGTTIHLPYWLDPSAAEEWLALDELNRAAYYYIVTTEAGRNLKATFRLDYSELLSNPQQIAEQLAEVLTLQPGAKTPQIISEITADKPVDASIINTICADLRGKIDALYPNH